MKKFKIAVIATLIACTITSLAGCSLKDNVKGALGKNQMEPQGDGTDLWNESNTGLRSIGIDDAKMQGILDTVSDYVICINLPKKNATYTDLLSDGLKDKIENRAYGDEDVQCPQDCNEYLETGYCEHVKEIEASLENGFDQDEEIDWTNGKQKIKDIKLNVIYYSTYYEDDKKDVMFIVHMSGSPIKDSYAARVHYNAVSGKIESIEI